MGFKPWAALGLAMTAGAALTTPAQAQVYRFSAEAVLGAPMGFTVLAPAAGVAQAAAVAARAEIARLDAILSGWRADSELALLNRSAVHFASPDLFAVVAAAEDWRASTGGAFDGRLGRIEAAWRDASGQRPAVDDLRHALDSASVGLDPKTRRITRPDAVVFALDGLAKGYVIDRALAAARAAAPGALGMLLDIGGDIACWGQPPEAEGWRVGLMTGAGEALADIRLVSGALATSGRGPRDLVAAGERLFQVFSPEHRAPAVHAASVTVAAPTALQADALATAVAALPPERGLILAADAPGAQALIVGVDGARRATAGWSDLAYRPAQDAPRLTHVADAAAEPWPAGFKLEVDYTVPRFGKERTKQPYVAIWVTDEANHLVKALVMHKKEMRWAENNYIFWRRFGRSRPQVMDAVSKPTPRPGKYTTLWDGKDASGKPVPQGTYTVHLEAAREYGGHSYQSTTLTLGAAPTEATIAASGTEGDTGGGDTELGASKLSYGKK